MDDDSDLPDESSGYSSSLIGRLKSASASKTSEEQQRRVRFDIDSNPSVAGQQQQQPVASSALSSTAGKKTGQTVSGERKGFLDWGTRQRVSQQQTEGSSSQIPPTGIRQVAIESDQQASGIGSYLEKERELEQLRREISSLRYENSENLSTVEELRRKLDATNEEHKKIMNNLSEQHREEIQNQNRRHERELDDLKRNFDKSQDILNNIKHHDSSFECVQGTIGTIREMLQTLCGRGEDMDKLLKLFNEQKIENLNQIETISKSWEQERNSEVKRLELEVQRITEQYSNEIVKGRMWLDDERIKLRTEKAAFRDEQMFILNWMEKKKDELEGLKSDFLTKEHDLLVRIVNEKTLVEYQRQEFEHQKTIELEKIRKEARELESNLSQVENARNALLKARGDYKLKMEQLDQIKEMLLEYEKIYWNEARQAIRQQRSK